MGTCARRVQQATTVRSTGRAAPASTHEFQHRGALGGRARGITRAGWMRQRHLRLQTLALARAGGGTCACSSCTRSRSASSAALRAASSARRSAARRSMAALRLSFSRRLALSRSLSAVTDSSSCRSAASAHLSAHAHRRLSAGLHAACARSAGHGPPVRLSARPGVDRQGVLPCAWLVPHDHLTAAQHRTRLGHSAHAHSHRSASPRMRGETIPVYSALQNCNVSLAPVRCQETQTDAYASWRMLWEALHGLAGNSARHEHMYAARPHAAPPAFLVCGRNAGTLSWAARFVQAEKAWAAHASAQARSR